MSRSRQRPRRRNGDPCADAKRIESQRYRARQRVAMSNPETLPAQSPQWHRWDRWSWD